MKRKKRRQGQIKPDGKQAIPKPVCPKRRNKRPGYEKMRVEGAEIKSKVKRKEVNLRLPSFLAFL
jgi:hypothetical protein